MEQPGRGEDPEEHVGLGQARRGRHVERADDEERGDVLQIVQVHSPDPLHDRVAVVRVRAPEGFAILLSGEHLPLNPVVNRPGRVRHQLRPEDSGAKGERGEDRVVRVERRHRRDQFLVQDRRRRIRGQGLLEIAEETLTSGIDDAQQRFAFN